MKFLAIALFVLSGCAFGSPAIRLHAIVKLDTGTGFCSGVVTNMRSGQILTNKHCTNGRATTAVTLYDGRALVGTVIGESPTLDIAVVDIADGAARDEYPLGDSDKLEHATEVYALGHPRAMDWSVSKGIVMHPKRVWDGVTFIQVDAVIIGGNSGGALVNMQGELVGILHGMLTLSTFTPAPTGIGFAVPINDAIAAIRSMNIGIQRA